MLYSSPQDHTILQYVYTKENISKTILSGNIPFLFRILPFSSRFDRFVLFLVIRLTIRNFLYQLALKLAKLRYIVAATHVAGLKAFHLYAHYKYYRARLL